MGKEKIKVYTYTRVSTSMHVETIALLSKLHQAKHHINVKVNMESLRGKIITSQNHWKANSQAAEEKVKAIEDAMRHFQML